jgi:transcription initiation factor TFIIIB Brf1 subunit/transcription initiation factor TFIIB
VRADRAINRMEKACRSLELPSSIFAKALQLYARARETTDLRRPRLGLAAACVYAAAKLEGGPWTQLEVAKEVGVTEPTLRANIKIIAPLVRCERELGERQGGRAFCSAQDNWCSHQGEIWRCPLRKRGAEGARK